MEGYAEGVACVVVEVDGDREVLVADVDCSVGGHFEEVAALVNE